LTKTKKNASFLFFSSILLLIPALSMAQSVVEPTEGMPIWKLFVVIVAFVAGVVIGTVFFYRRYHRFQLRYLADKLEELEERPDVESITELKETSEADVDSEQPKLSASVKTEQEAPTGELTGKIYSILSSIDKEETEKETLVKRVLLNIRANMGKSVPVAQLAKQMHVSPRTLQRSIKETFNCSPKDIVIAVKMHEAKRMILTGDFLVNEIAYSVGFEEPSHFSKRFKAQYGMAPSKLVNASKKAVTK